MGIALPGTDVLPPGPRRDLVLELRRLHDLAGQPGARVLASAIRRNPACAETVSHETVAATLRGRNGAVPAWAKLRSIVIALGQIASADHELPDDLVQQMQVLWLAARAEYDLRRRTAQCGPDDKPLKTSTPIVNLLR